MSRTFFRLKINYSKTFQYRTKENHNNKNRCNILNHNRIKLFTFKLSTRFHFIHNRFRLDNISCKYTGKERYDWHNHAITQEIKEVQNRKSPYLNMVPNTKSQSRRYCNNHGNYRYDNTGLLSFLQEKKQWFPSVKSQMSMQQIEPTKRKSHQ